MTQVSTSDQFGAFLFQCPDEDAFKKRLLFLLSMLDNTMEMHQNHTMDLS